MKILCTNQRDKEKKNEFYEKLITVFENVPVHDLIFVNGDFDANVRSDNTVAEGIMGEMDIGHAMRTVVFYLTFVD